MIPVVLVSVVFDSVFVAEVKCEDSYLLLLGGMRSTTRTNIVVVVNNTTKDINKLASSLSFYFVMFFPVFPCFSLLFEKAY